MRLINLASVLILNLREEDKRFEEKEMRKGKIVGHSSFQYPKQLVVPENVHLSTQVQIERTSCKFCAGGWIGAAVG